MVGLRDSRSANVLPLDCRSGKLVSSSDCWSGINANRLVGCQLGQPIFAHAGSAKPLPPIFFIQPSTKSKFPKPKSSHALPSPPTASYLAPCTPPTIRRLQHTVTVVARLLPCLLHPPAPPLLRPRTLLTLC